MARSVGEGSGIAAERKNMEEIEFVKSMQTLEIRENDLLILKVSERLRHDAIKTIIEHVKAGLPDPIKGKVKVFVLEPGMDIGVVRGKEAP